MAQVDYQDLPYERAGNPEPVYSQAPFPDGNDPTHRSDSPPELRWPSQTSNSPVNDIFSKYGIAPGETDAANYAAKNPEDRAAYLRALEEQAKVRAASGGDRSRGGYDTNLPDNPAQRAAITAAQSGGAPFGAGRTTFGYGNPGDQFSDPYTRALEDLVKQQLASIQQPQSNPALDRLLSFLDTQFTQKSQSPGYTDAEQALLRTQALEPIEQDRTAAQKRSLARVASRGMLPSSGLAELDARETDLEYDRLRGAAQRDLGINAINRRNQDLTQALTLGQMAGVQIPQMQRAEDQQRRNEALSLASLLYQLPRNAMNDALAVVNGTPAPGDLFSQAVQLLSVQNQQRQFDRERQGAFWEQIGSTLEGLFG